MKVLLVTFSDNADHQDITFGMFESLFKAGRNDCEAWVMGINTPKVPIMDTPRTHLVDCPKRPGIEKKTFDLKELNRIISWIKEQKFVRLESIGKSGEIVVVALPVIRHHREESRCDARFSLKLDKSILQQGLVGIGEDIRLVENPDLGVIVQGELLRAVKPAAREYDEENDPHENHRATHNQTAFIQPGVPLGDISAAVEVHALETLFPLLPEEPKLLELPENEPPLLEPPPDE